MNIGLDLRPSLSKPTGVGAYVLSIAQRLPGLGPEHRFFYFSASMRERYPHREWPANVTLVDRRLPTNALNMAWNRLGAPALDRLVTLIHDIEDGRRELSIETFNELLATCKSASITAS